MKWGSNKASFQVGALYYALKFSALHRRIFLFAIFSENGGKVNANKRRLRELYARAKALFDLVAPQEYNIEASEEEEIGVLSPLPLLREIVAHLEAVRNSGGSGLTIYFTKESRIHTLINLVLYSDLPITNPRIPELDYSSYIIEGARSFTVLDSALDSRHALNAKARRKSRQHLDYGLVLEELCIHRVPEDEDESLGPLMFHQRMATRVTVMDPEAEWAVPMLVAEM